MKKTFPKVGLLAVVALLATAAMATSAQAVTINPDNTQISGHSTDSSLSYGVATIRCDQATADGTTGLDSDRITNLALQFFDNCAVVGVAPAEVACEGYVTLIARSNDSSTVNRGWIRLNGADEPELGDPAFKCVVTTSLCEVTVQGPQNTTPDPNTNLNEDTDVLNASVNVQASRIGNTLCGPSSGTANFTANYATTPDTLSVDP